MDIQSTLTLAIEVIFWAMISFMLNDFINGIFLSFAQPKYIVSAQPPSPVAEINDIPNHVVAESEAHQEYQFEEIPDPWKLEVEPQNTTTEPQTVVIPFPALRLLPPAQSESIQSTTTAKSPQKRGRPRKSA
ncbi:MAG: hypothetical protein AB3A66_27230 (plasmid) [Nodularia sp. CChRGM 3473]